MNPRHDPLFKGNRLQTSCEVSLSQGRLLPHELVYRFSDVEFWLQPQPDPEEQFELGTDSQQFRFTRTQGRPWPLHHPVKTYLFPNEVRSYYQNSDFLGDFELAYERLMDSVYYLGPLREYPQREYHWGGSSPEDVGQRGERTMDAILAATRDNMTRRLRPLHEGFGRCRSRR